MQIDGRSEAIAEVAHPAKEFKYHAFLSYATDPDYRLARELERFLESFHHLPLPAQDQSSQDQLNLEKLEICRDGSDFPFPRPRRERDGDAMLSEVRKVIEAELTRSRFLLVLASASACRSPFVEFEMEWFLRHRPTNILVAITEGEEPAANPASVIPKTLLEAGLDQSIWYDFRGFRTREAKHWKKVRSFDDERVQLAAHLNGATLGVVRPIYVAERQREERRKRLTAYGVAAGFFLLAVLAAIFALQRELARRDTQNALTLEKKALTREEKATLAERDAASAATRALGESLLDEGETLIPQDPGQAVAIAFAARNLTNGFRSARLLRSALEAHPVYRHISTAKAGPGARVPSGDLLLFDPAMNFALVEVPTAHPVRGRSTSVAIVDIEKGRMEPPLDIETGSQLIVPPGRLSQLVAICGFSNNCRVYRLTSGGLSKPVLELANAKSIALASRRPVLFSLDWSGNLTEYTLNASKTAESKLVQLGLSDMSEIYTDPAGVQLMLGNFDVLKPRLAYLDLGKPQPHLLEITSFRPELGTHEIVWATRSGQALLVTRTSELMDVHAIDFVNNRAKILARSVQPVFSTQIVQDPRQYFTANVDATRFGIFEREGDENSLPKDGIQDDPSTRLQRSLSRQNELLSPVLNMRPAYTNMEPTDTSGRIRFYDVEWQPGEGTDFVTVRRQAWTLPIFPAAPDISSELTDLALSPDGEYVADIRGSSLRSEFTSPAEIYDLLAFKPEPPGGTPLIPIPKRLGPFRAKPNHLAYSEAGNRVGILDDEGTLYVFEVKTGPADVAEQASRAPDRWDRFFYQSALPMSGSWLTIYDDKDARLRDFSSGKEIPVPMNEGKLVFLQLPHRTTIASAGTAWVFKDWKFESKRSLKGAAEQTAGIGDALYRLRGNTVEIVDGSTFEAIAEFRMRIPPRPIALTGALLGKDRYRVCVQNGQEVDCADISRGSQEPQRFMHLQWSKTGDDRAATIIGDLVFVTWADKANRPRIEWYDLVTGERTQKVLPPPGGWPNDTMIVQAQPLDSGGVALIGYGLDGEVSVGLWPARTGNCAYWKKLGTGIVTAAEFRNDEDLGFILLADADLDKTGYRLVRLRDDETVFSGEKPCECVPPPPLTEKNGQWTVEDEPAYRQAALRVMFGGLDSYESITNTPPPPTLEDNLDVIRRYRALQTVQSGSNQKRSNE